MKDDMDGKVMQGMSLIWLSAIIMSALGAAALIRSLQMGV